MTIFDCMVIGAGPAGLSAGLTLGRARRKIAVLDDGTNRNRVTQESHGFITRDGIKPQEFKNLGLDELKKYPSVSIFNTTVTEITKEPTTERLKVKTKDGHEYNTEKVILATGVQEMFPAIPAIKTYYGKSLFSCPYCDGWELRDKPLVIIAEKEDHSLHLAKLVYNWSEDLVVATNGNEMSIVGFEQLQQRGIKVMTEPILKFHGEDGYLQQVEFESGEIITRIGGFVMPSFYRPNKFVEKVGCELNELGAAVTDGAGRTSIKNIYIAGEMEKAGPSSLLIAAADGSKAAFSVNMDLTTERF
ncbi:NAD(P)/FAD-dependent oxidoreductase [Psychrobacillus sp. NPDC058041]|uniref:NAD(P)/FAD-dependent oxidoreductase n=1 Tax=Psychrobacillus sp. NPDC058041 TaxID=3346310 RepID=UPI0036DC393D